MISSGNRSNGDPSMWSEAIKLEDSLGDLGYTPEVTQNGERRIERDEIFFDVITQGADDGGPTSEKVNYQPRKGRLARFMCMHQRRLSLTKHEQEQQLSLVHPTKPAHEDGQHEEIIWHDRGNKLRRIAKFVASLFMILITAIIVMVFVTRSIDSPPAPSPIETADSISKYISGSWYPATAEDLLGPALGNTSQPYSSNNFGHIVRLSDDGQQLAVAVSVCDEYAPAETTRTNRDGESGDIADKVFPAVYVYRSTSVDVSQSFTFSSSSWTFEHRLEPPSNMIRHMKLPTASETYSDQMAESMTMSGDGKRIAMTAGDFVLIFEKKETMESAEARWELLDQVLDPWNVGFINATMLAARNDRQTTLVLSKDGESLVIRGIVGNQVIVRVFTYQPDVANDNDNTHAKSTTEWKALASDIFVENCASCAGGLAVSANGRRVAIGMRTVPAGGGGIQEAGSVEIYDWRETDQTWIYAGNPIYGTTTFQRFGSVLTLSSNGDMLIVSSTNDNGGGFGGGQVQTYVYSATHSDWNLQSTLRSQRPLENFGAALELSRSGTILVVGAPGTPMHRVGESYYANHPESIYSQLGQVFVYELSMMMMRGDDPQDPYWQLRSPSSIFPPTPNDDFGTSIAVNGDGSRVAVGAPWRPSSYTAITDVRGAVALYRWIPILA